LEGQIVGGEESHADLLHIVQLVSGSCSDRGRECLRAKVNRSARIKLRGKDDRGPARRLRPLPG
jgi:hypothetical protein